MVSYTTKHSKNAKKDKHNQSFELSSLYRIAWRKENTKHKRVFFLCSPSLNLHELLVLFSNTNVINYKLYIERLNRNEYGRLS